jgi:hypothetical protein
VTRNTRLLRAFAVAGLFAAILTAAVGVASVGEGSLAERVQRLVFLGTPLLEVLRPTPGQQMAYGGVQVHVGFPEGDRVAVESFRCLLNDRDVTHLLTLGSNGATGSVLGLVEGENSIRIEVFGRGWWSARYFQDSRTVVFHVRPYPSLDRA